VHDRREKAVTEGIEKLAMRDCRRSGIDMFLSIRLYRRSDEHIGSCPAGLYRACIYNYSEGCIWHGV